jgi:phosphoenolpyruvate carboxylase
MPPANTTESTGLHPTARPAEKRQDISFAAKDTGLREDVHNLATLVGELLREQGGEALFEVVERGRRAAIGRREGDADAGRQLDELVRSLSAEAARDIIRAFSTYFQVVNTAEQVHRIRRRRDYLKDASTRQPGSLEDTMYRLHAEGLSLAQVQKLLRVLSVEPVFMAHPTEPTRRTILRKQQNIVRRLIDIQNPMLTPQEEAANFASIRDDVTAIWQTEEMPHGARTSFDDLEHVLFFLTEVIYRAIPVLYETLEMALVSSYGSAAEGLQLPTIVRFASWIGGDMAARPDTTARTIRQTLARQRSLILDLYYNECRRLAEKLSQSRNRVNMLPEMLARIDDYAGHFPNAAGSLPLRHREMPYRIFLRLIMQRLQATYNDDAFPYESADELLADLRLIARSLVENRGRHAGLFQVRRLIRRVETFGFHFLTLDICQNALVNRGVVGRCLGERDWMEQSAEYRASRIRTALERNESPTVDLDNESKRDLAVFQAIAFCRRKYGSRAIGPYIVSMAHGLDDVLSVILLARWGDLRRRSGAVPLDIAPYFETVEDLESCGVTMDALLNDPLYRDHLSRRDNRQTVMVSYSDSNQDAGLAEARWSLQQAQLALVQAVDRAGVELTLFHGRGGTISRGGGKTHAAVLGSPPGSVRGRLRATEQGELVNAKYGLRGIALRTLEQAVGSVALASSLSPAKNPAQEALWTEMMALIAGASEKRYRSLVYDSEDFFDYFRAATPVDVLQRMRVETAGEDEPGNPEAGLRDVPWDFAWMQSRHALPGWYGIGSGLAKAISEFGLDNVQTMARDWPFFGALLSDAETVLAKADLHVAHRYSDLAGPLHDQFFPLMRAEFDLSIEKVLQVRSQQVLLEFQPSLRRAIRLRNPYVDPMSLMQVELLRRWRQANRPEGIVFDALVASINGIARGLQDFG